MIRSFFSYLLLWKKIKVEYHKDGMEMKMTIWIRPWQEDKTSELLQPTFNKLADVGWKQYKDYYW